jgi:hypothetical protein
MVMTPPGLRPENDCAGEDHQEVQVCDIDPCPCQRERSTSINPQISDSNKNLLCRI